VVVDVERIREKVAFAHPDGKGSLMQIQEDWYLGRMAWQQRQGKILR